MPPRMMLLRNLTSRPLFPVCRKPILNHLFARCFSNDKKSSDKQITFTATSSGELGTLNYQIGFKDVAGKDISPWHDIPLENGNFHNFICEIPKFARAKMEIAKSVKNNPIMQDTTKDEKPRYYDGPIFWNYGYFPQTWESPYVVNEHLNLRGDNDPLDVVEIGSRKLETGSIATVKVLGVFAMVDGGELDWKIIAINVDDPISEKYYDINDVDPVVISGIREWFRWYKTPSGKPLNSFEYNEMCLPRSFAYDVIDETHNHWIDLVHPREGQERVKTEDKLWIGSGFSR